MGRFIEMPDGSAEWDEHDETRPPLPTDPDDLHPAHDYYVDGTTTDSVPRAARVGGRLRKQAS